MVFFIKLGRQFNPSVKWGIGVECVIRAFVNNGDEHMMITKKPLPKIACIVIAVACLAYEFSPFTWLDNVALPLPFGFVDDGIAVVALVWSIREYRRHGIKVRALPAPDVVHDVTPIQK